MLNVNPADPTGNPGFKRMFSPGKMTLGVFFPIEAFQRDMPTMHGQMELAQKAEQGGFSALWFRDVPLRDPQFGDIGQVFDPWVYLGYVAAHTRSIALATGAIVLPLRHPLHTAKAAASVDQLSRGRLVLGIASGDRPIEFPAFDVDFDNRGKTFREYLEVFHTALGNTFPRIDTPFCGMAGADLVPKGVARSIPVLVTGHSQQELSWIAENSDGWVMYPRSLDIQEQVVQHWRAATARARPDEFLPFAQSLYIDLDADPDCPPYPIHLGFRLGRNALLALLLRLQTVGVNHVVLNLKYGHRHAAEVLQELIEHIAPTFPPNGESNPTRSATSGQAIPEL